MRLSPTNYSARHWYIGFWALILFIGGALLVAAAWLWTHQQQGIWLFICSSTGSALFGTALATFLTVLREIDSRNSIAAIIREHLSPGLIAEEADLIPYRSVFHHYHVTRVDQSYVWRYQVVDLSSRVYPGRLIGRIFWPDARRPTEVRFEYRVSGIPAGSRFILVFSAIDRREEAQVEIYPLMGKVFTEPHSGFAFVDTYDSTALAAGPCLLSTRELVKSPPGTLDEKASEILDDLWAKGIRRTTTDCLPRSPLGPFGIGFEGDQGRVADNRSP